MTERDPLSPASLAAVPEVRQAYRDLEEAIIYEQDGRAPSPRRDAASSALLLAVRDATLKAERERVCALTPEQVVEEAIAAHLGHAKPPRCTDVAENHGPHNCGDCYRLWSWDNDADVLRAALPVLLAPEVARREQAERERDEAWEAVKAAEADGIAYGKLIVEAATLPEAVQRIISAWHKGAEQYAAAEAERDRLRGALNTLVERCTDYRAAHDIQGDGSHEAGYAWDQMRKAEQAARAALEAK